MRIIVEGCDGVGKSTYASFLADTYGCDVIHMTSGSPKNLRSYLHRLRNDNVIFDRFFISEVIYSKVFMRKTKIREFEIRFLLFVCKLMECKIYVMTHSDDVILARLKARDDESDTILNHISELNKAYVEFAEKYKINILDWSKIQ